MINIKKRCLTCQNKFYVYPNPQNIRQKYCNRKCYVKSLKGRKITWGNKISIAKKGHGWSKGFYERQSNAQKERFKKEQIWNKGKRYGKASWYWRDNPNAYRRLHKRIYRKYGAPKICEHCGITDLKRYHWANKSGNYKEDREDWTRLCAKCHYEYDHHENRRI